MEISVVICAHNPRSDYLSHVLRALQAQTAPKEQWELLLIDNASKIPLVSIYDLSWHPNARCVVESKLGLAFARMRGIREASGRLLVFVDDDNVLDGDYLSTALHVAKEWPLIGVWGSGAIVPEFEVDPDASVEKFLALRNNDKAYWSNVPFCDEATPWGCGLCVRAEVAKAYCEFNEQGGINITGRHGKELWGGEDTEICLVSCRSGYGTAVFPELRLVHLTPRERVTEAYLLRTIEGDTASRLLLDYKWRNRVPNSPYSARSLLSLLKNVLLNRGLVRRVKIATWYGCIKAKRAIQSSYASRN